MKAGGLTMSEQLSLAGRGILNPVEGEKKFQLQRLAPTEELRGFVRHYWLIDWDLRGQSPYRQEVLQNPCINIVFMQGYTRIYGVSRKKSFHLLEGQGSVFGVQFKPGAFYPYWQAPVASLTDRSIQLEEVFGPKSGTLEKELFSTRDSTERVAVINRFLGERLPMRDDTIELIQDIVDRIIEDHAVTSVDHLACCFNINKRKLQRMFHQYVGVTPKWVIQRYRLHEAAEQIARSNRLDWPHLAAELGYFDQAHFIKDFKAVIGFSPEEYIRRIAVHET
jgi:AraC-like DNA-binding protein